MEFELFGIRMRVEVVVACVLLGYLIGGMLLCSCSKVGLREGLTMLAPGVVSGGEGAGPNWVAKATEEQDKAGYTPGNIYAGLAGNKAGKVPLPEGEMDLFYDNKFDPSCCATSSYSGSSGCACISPQQMQFLNARGGNRSLSGGSVF